MGDHYWDTIEINNEIAYRCSVIRQAENEAAFMRRYGFERTAELMEELVKALETLGWAEYHNVVADWNKANGK